MSQENVEIVRDLTSRRFLTARRGLSFVDPSASVRDPPPAADFESRYGGCFAVVRHDSGGTTGART